MLFVQNHGEKVGGGRGPGAGGTQGESERGIFLRNNLGEGMVLGPNHSIFLNLWGFLSTNSVDLKSSWDSKGHP